jgi:predicted nucleotidyltransferase
MLTNQEIEQKLRLLKPTLAQKFNVKKIGYFGSYATGYAHEDSDVDILVEFSEPLGWEFCDLQVLLEDSLQKKVDLVSVSAVKPQLRNIIFEQVKYV